MDPQMVDPITALVLMIVEAIMRVIKAFAKPKDKLPLT